MVQDIFYTVDDFIAARRCAKLLYLMNSEQKISLPIEDRCSTYARQRKAQKLLFNLRFPGGIGKAQREGHFKSDNFDLNFPFEEGKESILFDACFSFDEIIISVDVFEKNKKGEISIYDLHGYDSDMEALLWKLSIKYYVINHLFSDQVNFFLVMHDEQNKFSHISVKEAIEPFLWEVKNMKSVIKDMHENGSAPKTQMGQHCQIPEKCVFTKICIKDNLEVN